jgi:hypothetical protein
MALWSVGFLGSRPFAATVDGAVADHVSLSAAFGLVAALGIVVAWLCHPSRLIVGVAGRRNAAGTLVP